LAIPWCFYKISRAFDGFSTSIIWQKDHPPQLKHRPIFRLLSGRELLRVLIKTVAPTCHCQVCGTRRNTKKKVDHRLHVVTCRRGCNWSCRRGCNCCNNSDAKSTFEKDHLATIGQSAPQAGAQSVLKG